MAINLEKLNEPILWWGYKHELGTFQAKRYSEKWGQAEMDDAYESLFVKEVFGPFEANSRYEALKIVENLASKSNLL